MNRRLVLAITLAIILVGMLTLTFNIQPVRPDWTLTETIYIRADGSVDPSTPSINREGNIYTFAGNIYDEIVIQRDNIVVDGAGYIVQGTGAFDSHGIDLNSRTNVTIKNVEIKEFQNGISLEHSNDNKIYQNYLTNNIYGVVLFYSSNNIISGNKIANSSSDGIYLQNSANNSMTGNDVINNYEYGVVLDAASNNTFYNNNFIGNAEQVHVSISGYPNIWDNGTQGNFWSDYEEKYPNATEIDGSGIWDTPYVINENNQDNHPIVPEFPSFLILPLFMIATLAIVVYIKKKEDGEINS